VEKFLAAKKRKNRKAEMINLSTKWSGSGGITNPRPDLPFLRPLAPFCG
jgi:hypothetical protein